jgi:hypothetical protein
MPQPVAARWTCANPAHGVSLDAKPGGDYRRFSLPPPFASTLACRSGRQSTPDHTTVGRRHWSASARPTAFRAGERQVDSRSSRRGRTTPNDRSRFRVPRLEPATIGATRPPTLATDSALGTGALPGRKVNRIGHARTERTARPTPCEASRAAHIGIDVRVVAVRAALAERSRSASRSTSLRVPSPWIGVSVRPRAA